MRKAKKFLPPLIIFLIAFFVRLLFIGRYFGQDEVYYVGYSKDLLSNRPFTSVFPLFFEVLLAPFILFFGDSELVIHVFTALLGSLNVLVLYLIGKKFFNNFVGIIAALLLTFNTTHWFFSNFAMLDVPATLFSTIGIYFYWDGYKNKEKNSLFYGLLFTSLAILTRYTFFPAIFLLGYILLFDRKKLFDKKILIATLIPLFIFGLLILNFIYQAGWLWSWWSSYFSGNLGYTQPSYFYFGKIFDEYLLPFPTIFIFTSSLLILSQKFLKKKMAQFLFLSIFLILSSLYYYRFFNFEFILALSFLTAAVLFIYGIRGSNFNKFISLYFIGILIFFSFFGVKFARYVLPAIPFLYLIVSDSIYSLRKYKLIFLISFLIIALFIFLNVDDTSSKLIVDANINEVKFEVQDFINKNSQSCSQVYSKTWYGFYYLRERITDLPQLGSLDSLLKSNCDCPPKFFLSEGVKLTEFENSLIFEKAYAKTFSTYRLTNFKSESISLSPIYLYSINQTLVDSLCRKS